MNKLNGEHHVALVKGDIGDGENVLSAVFIPNALQVMLSVQSNVTAVNSLPQP